ncbi:MAG: alpha/beta fold hydrolase [Acidobacteriota bacterium]|nr:alpha/beta fold hydrolase [Acidobacteriota bacterium]
MSIKVLLVIAALLFCGCHAPRVVTVDSKQAPLDVPNPPGRQTAQVFEKTNYLLYLPDEYGKGEKRWPLILYLHGRSLRGNDLKMLKRYGLAALLEHDLSIPFIVVSPQCAGDRYWMDEDEMLIRLVDDVSSKYAVDPERIYVTGHSMGGRGTWLLAYRQPQKFAAIVPMSDAPLNNDWAKQIAKVPAWVFHGTKDDLEPFERTQKFVDALKKLGADVKLTPLPGRDHYILDAYENKEIYDWLLQHTRKPTAAP